jgi:pyridoxamine 5'-phosphate oxidase
LEKLLLHKNTLKANIDATGTLGKNEETIVIPVEAFMAIVFAHFNLYHPAFNMIEIAPPLDPWDLFADWFDLAKQHETSYPEAMVLATVGDDGMPSARAVLMKSFDAQGVVFHTNRESRKGRQFSSHPKAACCFHWKSMSRQVHLEGVIAPISDAESDAYFATRPRLSQIGAWASKQSQVLESRAMLERRVKEFEEKFAGMDVPRPPHWGGNRLTPSRFEFWSEQPYRLHDRISYERDGDMWDMERYYP